ncbi:MAG TPA: hypothetical protein VNN80_03865 [Polyangiaceae bacterium]|nr:hypothetical protein [Polyangiaceae bacterium]HWP04472.1 hypothetical protein [Polyangiaceae bacterium]
MKTTPETTVDEKSSPELRWLGGGSVTFDVREQRSLTLEKYRLKVDWRLRGAALEPTLDHIVVVTATSLPLGVAVSHARLVFEPDRGIELEATIVNVLGYTLRAARHGLGLDVYEQVEREEAACPAPTAK